VARAWTTVRHMCLAVRTCPDLLGDRTNQRMARGVLLFTG